MKRFQHAFTLIELMIVVAIIGILAAIALPAYQDYVIRARVSEAIGKLGEMKTTISEYAASSSDMPASAAVAGIDTGAFGTYVSAASLTRNSATSADVSVTLQNFNVTALDGNNINFNCTRSSTTNVVTCSCSVDATTMYRYVPANCRSTS